MNQQTNYNSKSDNKVVIHNNIYKVNLGQLNSKENDLFFAILSFLRNKENVVVKFTLNDLKNLINDTKISNKELEKLVVSFWEKLRVMNFWIIGEGFKKNMMLFTQLKLNYEEKTNKRLLNVEIQLNTENFGYLINEIFKNFTQFDLRQFQSFKSKYAKNLFRLFKRYENVSFSDYKGNVANRHGHALMAYKYDIEGFKKFMGISNFTNFAHIEKEILIPACQELSDYIYCDSYDNCSIRQANLINEKPYKSIVIMKNRFDKNKNRSKGNKVIGIEFQYRTKESKTTETKTLNSVQQVKFVSSKSVKTSNFFSLKEIYDFNNEMKVIIENSLLNKEVRITVGNKIRKVKLATILDIKFQKSGKVKLDLIWNGQKEKKTINYPNKEVLMEKIDFDQ